MKRPVSMPTDPAKRKQYPLFTGLMEYFPDALLAVAHVSYVGDRQHNPGKKESDPVEWVRSKSTDQEDTTLRHLMEAPAKDSDGAYHRAKAVWRQLAQLQVEIEEEYAAKDAQQAQDKEQKQWVPQTTGLTSSALPKS